MFKRIFLLLFAVSVLAGCNRQKPVRFLREPMVGLVQNHEVPILVKTTSAGRTRIEYRRKGDENSRFTDWEDLSGENAFTANLLLKNLDYGTPYEYRVELAKGRYSKWYEFKTFPEQGKPGRFSVVFSSGMREKYSTPYVYENILQMSPTFVALMGDQMYGDYDGNLNRLEAYLADEELRKKKIEEGEPMLREKSVLDAFRGKYHRTFIESFQEMASHIPIMGIWDDHDMGQDNNDGTYPYKGIAKKVFKETYPAYPYETVDGGIYYRFQIADVDAFVLDTRWYRSPMQNPDGEEKKMLGDEQLDWLLDGLKRSTAPIKIIFSSIPFNDYGGDTSSDRPGYDGWMGFKHARGKVLSFIKENRITGVVVLSADQHFPSTHILNWTPPIKAVSETDRSIVFSLSELDHAIFDFSAGPFNYKRAPGLLLVPENQKNPEFSYEVYRADWAKRKNIEKYKPYKGTSVYGVAEFDTTVSPATIVVTFYELDKATRQMVELYGITLLE